MSPSDRQAFAPTGPERWDHVLRGPSRSGIEAALPSILSRQRWFGGKARTMLSARIFDAVPIPSEAPAAVMLLVEVAYPEDMHETYVLPVAAAFGQDAARIEREWPRAVLMHLPLHTEGNDREGVLYDALWNQDVARALLDLIARNGRCMGGAGRLVAFHTAAYEAMLPSRVTPEARIMQAEQSNTSVVYGRHALLKLYRRLQPGINPDLEVGRTLTSVGFPYSPPVGGAIEYVGAGRDPMTLALLQAFIPNQGDAWAHAVRAVEKFFGEVTSQTPAVGPDWGKEWTIWDLAASTPPEAVHAVLRPSIETAVCLGRRTAGLHLAMASIRDDPDFAPEPLSLEYRRARHASMCRLWGRTAELLANRRATLPSPLQEPAARLLSLDSDVTRAAQRFLDLDDAGLRIRCHGDYHLGQVLWTGTDCMIIDFEGEPARPMSERRMKHSPLVDVAGMVRSFHYASVSVPCKAGMEQWSGLWCRAVAGAFLKSYIADVQGAPFWPGDQRSRDLLLFIHLLEKAVYELGYELNNRPDWAGIPLQALLDLLAPGRRVRVEPPGTR